MYFQGTVFLSLKRTREAVRAFEKSREIMQGYPKMEELV
jgi:hypothetical protein